jgi:hypothetical protein
MALTLSTGFKNFTASGGGWGDAIKNGVIDIYTGTSPGAANAATGTKLVRITSTGALTAETRAYCRVAFATGTLAAGDTVTATVAAGAGNVTIGTFTGISGTANTVAANALKAAINSSFSYPDYYAVSAGTTVGSIRYGEVANAATEVYIIAPKNSGASLNTLSANLTVSTPANAAYAINGATANTATTFSNATSGGGGTSANGLGITAANGVSMTYPANVGLISKSGTWSGTALANGDAAYFRILCTPNYDDGTTNLNANDDAMLILRVDGTIGTSGADMTITNATLSANTAQTINQFDLTVA